jgi:C1A family cysteine protease
MYNFVRSRQLEKTFPGDAYTGVWPISSLRIARGWGSPPNEAWPYNSDASACPPSEPPDIDKIAKRFRIGLYQRVRTTQECKTILAHRNMPVIVSVSITDKWYSAPNGRILAPSPNDAPMGYHSVLLVGYNDSAAEFTFQNSCGLTWGDKGYGYIPYDTFDTIWWEGWVMDSLGDQTRSNPRDATTKLAWGTEEHGHGVFHCREFVDADDERIAWVFAVERSGFHGG